MRVRSVVAALTLAGLAGQEATAADGPGWRAEFQFKAGSLEEQLRRFGEQTLIDVYIPFDAVKGVQSKPVAGYLRPAQALQQMLANTGFVAEFVTPYNVAVKAAPAVRSVKQEARQPREQRSAEGDEVKINGSREQSPPLGAVSASLDRNFIDASGAMSLQEIMRALPQNFGGGPTEDTRENGPEAAANPARGYGVNLRGLGAGATLPLLNGRRLAASGSEGGFVDVSSLPVSALKCADVVPDSASTQYGADAVAGAVNYVMLDEFTGRRTMLRFGSTSHRDMTESLVSQIFGGKTRSGKGLIAFDVFSRGNLPADRREQMTSDLTPWGGTNYNQPYANPGTIFVGNKTYEIPENQDGRHLDLATLVEGQNTADRLQGADALPRQQRWSLFATWKERLTPQLEVFTDVLFAQRQVRGAGAPAAGLIPVPPTNPFLPNGLKGVPVAVGYSFEPEFGSVIGDGRVTTNNFALGLDRAFGGSIHVVGTAAYASEKLGLDLLNTLDREALQLGLADPDPETSVNLFGDGARTNPATIAKLRTRSEIDSRSELRALNLTAKGRWGWPVMAGDRGEDWFVGVDYRQQAFSSTTLVTPLAPPVKLASTRWVGAVFAEARVPLWLGDEHLPGLERLELSVGARYEWNSDFSPVNAPRYRLLWSPIPGATLHASMARSYRAPALLDQNESSNYAAPMILADPNVPGGFASVLLWSGKNEDLQPERSRSWSAGFRLDSLPVSGLQIATTYFDIHLNDRLAIPTLSADMLTNSVYAAMVTRNPTDAQVAEVCRRAPVSAFPGSCGTTRIDAILDLRVRNDALMHTRGIDMATAYAFDSALGEITFKLLGTHIIDFAEAKSHGLALQDRVNTQNNPLKLRLLTSVDWRWRGWNVTTAVNFANRYEDTASSPARPVHSMTTLDFNVAYTFDRWRGRWGLGPTTISLNAVNAFDRDPPFLNNGVAVGYDEENADIVGRLLSFSIRQDW
jgi:outer membrane receptor protein involved in Fe transport